MKPLLPYVLAQTYHFKKTCLARSHFHAFLGSWVCVLMYVPLGRGLCFMQTPGLPNVWFCSCLVTHLAVIAPTLSCDREFWWDQPTRLSHLSHDVNASSGIPCTTHGETLDALASFSRWAMRGCSSPTKHTSSKPTGWVNTSSWTQPFRNGCQVIAP